MGDRGRVASLDGVRGVAILLVLAEHAGIPGTRYLGTVGVQLFFVLSGYLITRLLLAEKARGGIDLRAFAVRRAARLVPALVVAATVCGGLWWRAVGHPFAGMAHTWSLAVEAIFYAGWSVTLARTPTRRIRAVAVAVGVASLALRIHFGAVTFRPSANMWAPMLGALLATTRFHFPRWISPLAPLGRISYGLYLWHYPLLAFGLWSPAARAGLVALSVALAVASYRWVERPAIRWASRRLDQVHGLNRDVVARRRAVLGRRPQP